MMRVVHQFPAASPPIWSLGPTLNLNGLCKAKGNPYLNGKHSVVLYYIFSKPFGKLDVNSHVSFPADWYIEFIENRNGWFNSFLSLVSQSFSATMRKD